MAYFVHYGNDQLPINENQISALDTAIKQQFVGLFALTGDTKIALGPGVQLAVIKQ